MMSFRLSRLWARAAPIGERVSVAVAASLAVVLLIWLVTPGKSTGTAGVGGAATLGAAGSTGAEAGAAGTTGGTTSGGAVGVGSGPAAVAGTSGTGAAATGSSGAHGTSAGVVGASGTRAGSNGGCASPPGTDQGVTSGSIKVAVIVLSIGGEVGNSTYNVPSPAVQKANFQKVVDSINASGGVACRKLLPVYFEGNPADSSNLQQVCLDVAQAKPFFLFEGGAYGYIYPSLASCYVQNHIPFLSPTFSTAQTQADWYPYAFFQGQRNLAYRNMIFALKQRGWFGASSGFNKLGVAYQNCDKQIPQQFFGWLHQAGLQDAQISSFDLGCSALFSPPSTIEQAILQFRRDGVTNVTFANDGNDWAPFTKVAQQQHFQPKYAITNDEQQVAVTYSNNAPDPNNIANALDIDNTASGEETTPGMSPSAVTDHCLSIFKDKVSYPITSNNVRVRYGEETGDCAAVWQFKTMAEHAPVLERAALAAGLQTARSVALPYPYAPVNWSAPHTTWGGQYWRVNQFFTSCGCWRLIDRTFHPDL